MAHHRHYYQRQWSLLLGNREKGVTLDQCHNMVWTYPKWDSRDQYGVSSIVEKLGERRFRAEKNFLPKIGLSIEVDGKIPTSWQTAIRKYLDWIQSTLLNGANAIRRRRKRAFLIFSSIAFDIEEISKSACFSSIGTRLFLSVLSHDNGYHTI